MWFGDIGAHGLSIALGHCTPKWSTTRKQPVMTTREPRSCARSGEEDPSLFGKDRRGERRSERRSAGTGTTDPSVQELQDHMILCERMAI